MASKFIGDFSGSTLDLDNGINKAITINNAVADGTTRDAIQLFENSAQATGRQAISWYNGNNSYNKASLWTEVGANFAATKFGIDVADNARNVSTRLWILNGNTYHSGNVYANSNSRMFADNYHPNADRWTTARTISLSGDASGSVAIDGSANVTIPVSVNNDSHAHTYLSERSTITYGASYLQWMDQSGTAGTGLNGSTPKNPTNDWYHHIIANHSNSAGYYVDLALCFHTNNHYINRLAGNGVVSTVKLWNDGNDGSGSGLDADLLDGVQGSSFLRSDADDTATGVITFTNSIMANGAVQVPYVAGTKKPMIVLQDATNYGLFHTEGANDDFTFDFGGVAKFTFNQTGNLTAAGDVTAYSDERLKSDIVTIPNALATVNALRGVNYVKDGKASTGVIAQEVEAVIPEVVHTADDEMGTKSVAYGNMMGVMIEAMKEMTAKMEAMQKEIDELRAK